MTTDRLLSIDEAMEQLGVRRTRLYAELTSGRLRSVHVGGRRLVPASEIGAYIERLLAEQLPLA